MCDDNGGGQRPASGASAVGIYRESTGDAGRRTRTREVGGVTQNVNLNRALWTLADEFAKLKQNQI